MAVAVIDEPVELSLDTSDGEHPVETLTCGEVGPSGLR